MGVENDINPADTASPETGGPAGEAVVTDAPSVESPAADTQAEGITPAPETAVDAGETAPADPSTEDAASESAPDTQESQDTPEDKPVEENVETPPSDEPAPMPTYEPFALPEGVVLNDGDLSEFTQELGQFEVRTKADHAAMQEFGQNLLNRYIAKTQETLDRLAQVQTDLWEKQKSGWKTSLESDPELGGNRLDTTTASLRKAVERFAGNEDQRKEFRTAVETYAWGNHPALVRLINNMNNQISKYETETSRLSGTPSPVTKPLSKVERRYGKTV